MLQMIKDKSFYKHLLLAGFTLIVLFIIWLKYLDFYTNHNAFFKVPDFKGAYIADLDSLFENYSLRYVIIDSVFDKSIERGLVVNQEPLPNTHVKKKWKEIETNYVRKGCSRER